MGHRPALKVRKQRAVGHAYAGQELVKHYVAIYGHALLGKVAKGDLLCGHDVGKFYTHGLEIGSPGYKYSLDTAMPSNCVIRVCISFQHLAADIRKICVHLDRKTIYAKVIIY